MSPYFNLMTDRFVHVYAASEPGERALARVPSGPCNSTQLERREAMAFGSKAMGVQNQGMVMEPNTGAMPTR